LFHLERFHLISGAGYFNAERTSPIASIAEDIHHTNFYVYSYISYPRNVTWIIGVSGDLSEGLIVNQQQINPKFGLIWSPFPRTTLRAAIFRTLERALISDQTIEPTQVAGFNQFFFDGEGTSAWRYGIAVDQRVSNNIYAGVEYSQRELDVPFISP
jgi:hypothetical protein